MSEYYAAIGTAADVVSGEYMDVAVCESVYGFFDGEILLGPVEIPVLVSDEDSHLKLEGAADAVLEEHGWRRVPGERWELSDNAAYARVERI